MILLLLSFVFGMPTIKLDVFNHQILCGYITNDGEHDTWAHTTSDHCLVLQQEAIEVWWDDTIITMKDRGEL